MSADEKAAYKARLWQAATDACRAWWAALDKPEREEAIETRARMLWDSYCNSADPALPEWEVLEGLGDDRRGHFLAMARAMYEED